MTPVGPGPKPLFWVASSQDDLRDFPSEVRHTIRSGNMNRKPNSKVDAAKAGDVRAGSGNLFADLGAANPDESLAKAELARQIGKLIEQGEMTQAQAAEVLGIDQPKVSALLRGKLESFSTVRLIRFLNALGQDVEIVVRPRSKRPARAHRPLRVVTGKQVA